MMNQFGAREDQNHPAGSNGQEIIDTAPQLPRRQLSHSSMSLARRQDPRDALPRCPLRQSNRHAGTINRNSMRRWAAVLDHSSTGSTSSGPPLSSVAVPSDGSVWSAEVSTLKSQDDDATVNVPPSVIEDEEMGSPLMLSSRATCGRRDMPCGEKRNPLNKSSLGLHLRDSSPRTNEMPANPQVELTDRRLFPCVGISPTSPPAPRSPGQPLPDEINVLPPPISDRFSSPPSHHPGNVAPPLPSRTPSDDGSIECNMRAGGFAEREACVAPPPFGQSRETVSSHGPAYGSASTSINDKNHLSRGQPVMIQVTPGVAMPLRGTDETWIAIELGLSTVTHCVSCQQDLTCLVDAELVACPDCPDCLSPVVQNSDDSDICKRYGIGIGVKLEDVQRWHERQES